VDVSIEASEATDPSGANRRTVLTTGGGLACLALLLGACSGGGQPTPGDDDADATSTSTGGVGQQVLAKVSEVPVGGGKLVGSVLLVNNGGTIVAFNAHCRHQGFIVDPPEHGLIVCENHGSTYKSIDGSVVQGPATQPLLKINIVVQGDQILRA
jgi:Rieske Fe-S protein